MPNFSHLHFRLFYREQGKGAPLILLPGNTATSDLHQGELDYFGERFHAACLDLPGNGLSDRINDWPDDWYQLAAQATCTLIDHLAKGPAILMGTSGGSVVALWAAIFHPEKVKAVIADSVVEKQNPAMLLAGLADRSRRTPDQASFWSLAQGDDWEQVIEADSDMLRRFLASGGDFFSGRLKEVRCPVLFTASLVDEMLPNPGEQQVAMARQVAGSRVYLAAEGSHPLMWSRPIEFRQVADLFLNGL